DVDLGDLVAAHEVEALQAIEEIVAEVEPQRVAHRAVGGAEGEGVIVPVLAREVHLIAGLAALLAEIALLEEGGEEVGGRLSGGVDAAGGGRLELPGGAELEDHAALRGERQAAVGERGVEPVLHEHRRLDADAAAAEQIDAGEGLPLGGLALPAGIVAQPELALAVAKAALQRVGVAEGLRVGALDAPRPGRLGDAQRVDGGLVVIVVLGRVVGGDLGPAVLAHRLRPVHLIVLEVDRRPRSAGIAARRHPVVERGYVDPAVAVIAVEVDRETAGLPRPAAEAAAGGLEGVWAQTHELALEAHLSVADVTREADAAAGELAAGDLIDAGEGLHLGPEAAGDVPDGTAEPDGPDFRRLCALDVAQDVGGHPSAHGPEVVFRRRLTRPALGELELEELIGLGGRTGEHHHHRHESGLVGDDLVETGREVLEEEVALRVRQYLLEGEIPELIGVDLGRREGRRLADHPAGHAYLATLGPGGVSRAQEAG